MPYALVKDATTAAAAAIAVGGTIVNGPREVPGGEWIAQGIDPQGAMFSVHSLKPAAKRAATKKKPAAKKQPAASNATKKKSTKNAAKVKAVARRKKPAAKKAAPKKAIDNNARLVALRVKRLIMCGTTIPTKPISPLTETAVAVAKGNAGAV